MGSSAVRLGDDASPPTRPGPLERSNSHKQAQDYLDKNAAAASAKIEDEERKAREKVMKQAEEDANDPAKSAKDAVSAFEARGAFKQMGGFGAAECAVDLLEQAQEARKACVKERTARKEGHEPSMYLPDDHVTREMVTNPTADSDPLGEG